MGYVYLALALIAAGFFSWLRTHHRILYGTSEVLVGVAILAVRFIVTGPDFLTAEDSGSVLYDPLRTVIAVFTGIYAIVRGLDNIVTTLREPYGR